MLKRVAFFAQKQVRLVTTASIMVLALSSGNLSAQQEFGYPDGVPPLPSTIAVPEGFKMFFSGHALGTQNYMCLPTASGLAWKFIAPQATLFDSVNGELGQQLTTHFLSANVEEGGLLRPTWQHSLDSSRVWGRLAAPPLIDANFVEAGAIPWLLLEKAGVDAGPTGGSFLTRTRYIQRLNTSGGAAPSTGCSQPAEIGTVAFVPYTADYFFYKAVGRPSEP